MLLSSVDKQTPNVAGMGVESFGVLAVLGIEDIKGIITGWKCLNAEQ